MKSTKIPCIALEDPDLCEKYKLIGFCPIRNTTDRSKFTNEQLAIIDNLNELIEYYEKKEPETDSYSGET